MSLILQQLTHGLSQKLRNMNSILLEDIFWGGSQFFWQEV